MTSTKFYSGRVGFQPILAIEESTGRCKQQNLSPIQIPTVPKDMDGQVKLAHRVFDVADCSKTKIFVTMLRYNESKPGSSAQVRLFTRKKEEEKFH